MSAVEAMAAMAEPAGPGAACPQEHPRAGYAGLAPLCCNPLAALAAFARVGGWSPPLPERGEAADAAAGAPARVPRETPLAPAQGGR
ncbi:hypothetical protein BKK79_10715 [Cupriavidus sp. USMAA2-4]|uniref:Uncharacterized protein n=1 Tax=Cupriavidus malaysiensis TaxID=367825 RepID=A0A1D9HXU3_9BURK|nr:MULTISPECIES: hypothetical protein [Cupriavidus]AOY92198.1 hypothetical protein BKK79_10715 [Cupriavidus sp. USMAA2-4]AOY98233.1 hypothetical protein BKK81_02160 [Cupriavidus sp. USMAHM13]AOZ04661.1 hypothetical protein BKK80_01490 [Cupriavidus malaysiensis]